jgi:hypothetical protein
MNSAAAPIPVSWRSTEFPLCELCVSVTVISQSVGVPLTSWSEDGLGSAVGFACRLPSGLLLQAAEFEHRSGQTSVVVDATDLVGLGLEATLAQVLLAFGLSSQHVCWVQNHTGLGAARKILETARSGKHAG